LNWPGFWSNLEVMRKGIDHFSGYFPGMGPENTKSPELLNRNNKGEIVDKRGATYDESGQLLREAPEESNDPYLKTALEKIQANPEHKNKSRQDQIELADILARILRNQAEEKERLIREGQRLDKKQNKIH
jgi:hypothetical protein